jgi:hypothetical protein
LALRHRLLQALREALSALQRTARIELLRRQRKRSGGLVLQVGNSVLLQDRLCSGQGWLSGRRAERRQLQLARLLQGRLGFIANRFFRQRRWQQSVQGKLRDRQGLLQALVQLQRAKRWNVDLNIWGRGCRTQRLWGIEAWNLDLTIWGDRDRPFRLLEVKPQSSDLEIWLRVLWRESIKQIIKEFANGRWKI